MRRNGNALSWKDHPVQLLALHRTPHSPPVPAEQLCHVLHIGIAASRIPSEGNELYRQRTLNLLFSPQNISISVKKPSSPARGAQTNIGHSREGKCQNSGAATQGGKWKGLGGLPRSTSSQRPGTYSSKIQSPSEPASIQSPGNQWLRMGPFHTSSPAEASGG